MPSAATKLSARPDPRKQLILAKLGDVPGFEIAQNELLVAIYQRDEMTPGGIVLPAKTLKEDVYQGKVGLVIKIGENFNHRWTDPYTGRTGGVPVKAHDWIMFRTSDTWTLEVNIRDGVFDKDGFVVCRMMEPKSIRAVIDNPDMVW
jgi:co-chaperonin GroES (HSP10)